MTPPLPPPPPLEPTLTALIISQYDGTTDEAGRYHTLDLKEPGKALFVEGHMYLGIFSRGMMHGWGKYTWSDGVTYEGDFNWNIIDGRGTFKWPDGATYVGEIKRGLRHGQGVFTGPGGAPCYSGTWNEGKRHGRGILWYDSGHECYYEGDWDANRRHGQGRMRWKPTLTMSTVLQPGSPRKKLAAAKEGNLYEGAWADDQKCGMGSMHWLDKRERYSGEWVGDQQHGHGEHIWIEQRPDANTVGTQKQMCNRYIGAWCRGERHGEGVFTYSNGARYSGGWARNLKEGYGVMVFEDGHVYEGPFLADRIAEVDGESPLRGPDETMQPQLRLHVGDIVAGDAERLRLEKAVLRHTSELRAVYKWYSSIPPLASDPHSFSMTMGQFRRLWADCALGSYDVSMVCVYRLCAAMRNQHACEVAALTAARKARESVKRPGSPGGAGARGGSVSSASSNSSGGAGAGAGAGGGANSGASGGGANNSTGGSSTSGAIIATFPGSAATYVSDQPLLFREFAELLTRIAVAAFSVGPTPGAAAAQAAAAAAAQAAAATMEKGTTSRSMGSERVERNGSASGSTGRPSASGGAADTARSVASSIGGTGGGGGGGSGGVSAGYLAPAEAFSQLMSRAICGAHSKPLVKGGFEAELRGEATVAVLAARRDDLANAFAAFGSADGRLKLRDLLALFAAAGASVPRDTGGLGLSHNDILKVLVLGSEQYPLLGDPSLLESELVWDEFVDALALLAHSARPADPDTVAAFDGDGGDGDDVVGDEAEDKVLPGFLGAFSKQPLHMQIEALLNRLNLSGAIATRRAIPVAPIPRAPRLYIALAL